jgi:hypothetical protein
MFSVPLLMVVGQPCLEVQSVIHAFSSWQRSKVFILALFTHAADANFSTVNAHGEVLKILGLATSSANSGIHPMSPKLRPIRSLAAVKTRNRHLTERRERRFRFVSGAKSAV